MIQYVLIAAFAIASPAMTERTAIYCHPKDTTARILKSPNPNDLHPDWTGENRIGTGWTLSAKDVRTSETKTYYIFGDLLSPRGGVVNKGVWVLTAEWDCDI